MFQNLLISPIVPLSNVDEIKDWENHPFRAVWPETQHDKTRKESEITKTIKKKSKRYRTAFTTEQLRALENTFSVTKYIDAENRRKLSESLKISDKAIKVWFQNRRMKEKRDSDSWDSSTESHATTPPSHIQITDFSSSNLKTEFSKYLNMPGLVDTSFFQSTNEHANYFQTQYQAPDVYESHNLGNMAPNHLPYFGYDANVYPTEYYPNYNANTNYQDTYNYADYGHDGGNFDNYF